MSTTKLTLVYLLYYLIDFPRYYHGISLVLERVHNSVDHRIIYSKTRRALDFTVIAVLSSEISF